MVIRSVYNKQDDILRAIGSLHCPEGFECDMTYGNGSFWKTLPRPRLCFDIDPQVPEATQGDSTNLPVESSTLSSVVFDPPFLTYVRSGRDHGGGGMIMASRFGGYWTYRELIEHYMFSIVEAQRVLKPKGIMVFKCQDIIHNHKMHCTHNNVINMANDIGFRLKDLFILLAKSRMTDNRKQQHSRIWHSYFLVLEKLVINKNKQTP